MNGIKAQSMETGTISLRERKKKKKKDRSNLGSGRAWLLVSGSVLGEADKSHIIDMIFRLSGRAYLITSDTLNPSQIRFPNRPTSRLTAAFRA